MAALARRYCAGVRNEVQGRESKRVSVRVPLSARAGPRSVWRCSSAPSSRALSSSSSSSKQPVEARTHLLRRAHHLHPREKQRPAAARRAARHFSVCRRPCLRPRRCARGDAVRKLEDLEEQHPARNRTAYMGADRERFHRTRILYEGRQYVDKSECRAPSRPPFASLGTGLQTPPLFINTETYVTGLQTPPPSVHMGAHDGPPKIISK